MAQVSWLKEEHVDGWQFTADLPLDDGREAHLWVGPVWPDKRYYTVALDGGFVCVEGRVKGRKPTAARTKAAAVAAAQALTGKPEPAL